MLTLPLISTVKKSTQIGPVLVKCCMSQTTSSSPLSYCVDLVKKLDYENYLCTLLLPHNLRASAFAIRAFNIELSRIQEQVTEPQIMPIRFKFWDDCLNDIYNDKTVVNHPVVKVLNNLFFYDNLFESMIQKIFSQKINKVPVSIGSSHHGYESILDIRKEC